MESIINKIRQILGNHESSQLSIQFFNDGEIVFNIYESEIPIVFNGKYIALDCETTRINLTTDMLNELYQISKLLDQNKDLLKSISFKTDK